MQLTLPSLDKISTNVRFVAATITRRVGLRASSALAPGLAGAWAERLFLTPPKPKLAQASLFDFLDAHAAFVEYRGRSLATWRWDSHGQLQRAPAVLLVHGWGGNSGQMRAFVQPLLAAGFRVIVFDQPAHGLSEGRLTGLPDLAGAIEAVAAWHGGVRHVIAHSLGGVATALALSRGLALERVVLLSPPSDMVGYSRRFARWLWIPERIRRRMQAMIEERYGVRWSDFELPRIAPRLRAPALVIHDRRDTMVPWKQGAALARAWPGARLLSTNGLGHGRLLEAEGAVRAAVAFIAGRSEVASPAQPALPDPAPLY
jgi:pimeloyl-ACP methyl ester carboxylesterase